MMLALLFLVISAVNAVPSHRLHTRSSHQVCGLQLVDMMSLVCSGNYARPDKRSSTLIDRITKISSNKFDGNGKNTFARSTCSRANSSPAGCYFRTHCGRMEPREHGR